MNDAPDLSQPDKVVLKTTMANDIAYALTGLALGPLELWNSLFLVWSPVFQKDIAGARGGSILVSIREQLGPAPLALGFGLFGFWLVCLGIGGVWRLLDRRPAISANREGVRFHPSICGLPVSWQDVRAVRATDGRPGQVRIDLVRRFWSPLVWATGHSVRLNNRGLGLSSSEAHKAVNAIKSFAPDQFRLRHSRSKRQAATVQQD